MRVTGSVRTVDGATPEALTVELHSQGGSTLATGDWSNGHFTVGRTYGFRSRAVRLFVAAEGYLPFETELEPAPRYDCQVTLLPLDGTTASTGVCAESPG
jgi:hypothetical protein